MSKGEHLLSLPLGQWILNNVEQYEELIPEAT